MQKKYLMVIIAVVILLCAVNFLQNYNPKKQEAFVSRIHSTYRPYIRKMHIHYENFMNKYGTQVIWNKMRKMGIY